MSSSTTPTSVTPKTPPPSSPTASPNFTVGTANVTITAANVTVATAKPPAGKQDFNSVTTPREGRGKEWYMWAVLTLFVGGSLLTCWKWPTPAAWFAVAVGMVLVAMAAGYRTNGYCFGLFVTERNTVSLSRFQMGVWTIVILSAFLTIAVKRVLAGTAAVPNPLDIAVPWQLWALMGISTTSLVGSPLLNEEKSRKSPEKAAVRRAQTRMGITAEETKVSDGTLYLRPWKEPAELSDLFRGDEVGNFYVVDIAKLQMFYFTLVCVLAYLVVLGNWIASRSPSELSSFPTLSDGLVALLGISHAGYLGSKKLSHTDTSPTR